MAGVDTVVLVLLTIISAATPLLFAAVGELVVERSGALNLGLEGMMLMGAVCGFIAAVVTGSAALGVMAAAAAGMAMALVFAFLTLTLLANQVATGLALTLFGVGLSSLLGLDYVGIPVEALPKVAVPLLSQAPFFGPLLFNHDALVYLSVAMVVAVGWFLGRTRPGMVLRAVGESHHAAHALGHNVVLVRYLAALFGGAMAGVGGAFLSLSYTPMWAENMTAGRGWIALALVVFASWRPGRALAGAYMFGGITILQLHAQGLGAGIASQYMSMLPYLVTVLVLVLISRDTYRAKLQAPACLGRIFHPAA